MRAPWSGWSTEGRSMASLPGVGWGWGFELRADHDAELGEMIEEPLPPLALGIVGDGLVRVRPRARARDRARVRVRARVGAQGWG